MDEELWLVKEEETVIFGGDLNTYSTWEGVKRRKRGYMVHGVYKDGDIRQRRR